MRVIRRQWRLRGRTGIVLAALTTLAVGGTTAATVAFAAGGASAATGASAPSWNGKCKTSPTITVEPFGVAPATPYNGPEQTFRYTLTNCHGMQLRLLTFGAITQSITVPGKGGRMANVALGFATLKDYVNFVSPPPTSPNFGGPYFGETVGRYANRIAKGTFKLNGQTYTLPINNGVNSLHGGFVGWGIRPWQATGTAKTKSSVSVTMMLVSPNGEEGSGLLPGTKNYEPNCALPSATPTTCTGYPAQVTVWVTFTLDNHNRFWIHYKATNDDSKLATVLNVTNHTYFNLAGEASAAGSAYSQSVQINANNYSPTDDTQIPLPLANGVPVAGTPFDFRSPHTIGSRISEVSAPDNVPPSFSAATGGKSQLLIAQGYDHNWILNAQTPKTTGPGGLNLAGEASAAGSAYSQFVQINARNYSPTDDTQIPLPLANGVPVAGTPFDFRSPHTIGSRINDVSAPDNTPPQFSGATGGKSQLLIAQGYDHNWILNAQKPSTTGPDGLNLAARAWDVSSGRMLTVWTDQPGVQFYSGNFLNGTLIGISGHTYRQGAGYTFETQHFPNSPNEPDFPSTTLGPGATFNSTTIFAFSSHGV